MEEYFSEPEANVIESSAGFSVRVLGRTGLRYMEGHRSVCIDSEVLAKPRAIALFKDSIRAWEGPDGSEQLNDEDRERIASNIKRAFESCGYEIEVHADFDWL
jgi:Immunity protein 74